jgi:myosin protein heavy chain
MAIIAKNEESGARRALQAQLEELELTTQASSSVHGELKEAMETYKSKADAYLGRLEEAEIARTKAMRAEVTARQALAEAEKAQAEAVGERKAAEERLALVEQQLRDLEAKFDDEGRDFADMDAFRRRLTDEMVEERNQYQRDLAERDFTFDQTRKKYQAELSQLSDELQAQRENLSKLREENRNLRSAHDELQLRLDDEIYNGGSWKKDKERLEIKIADLTAAYEASTHAQSEQQGQIVALLSQVRELRTVLDEAEAERAALQKARRTLENRLTNIAQEHVDTKRLSSDRALQELHLEKQDLLSKLEQQTDRAKLAAERVKKAEAFATECQTELSKARTENSQLEKFNLVLDKQAKEANIRIVDLETKSLAASRAPPSRRLESRIEELTNMLNQESKDKSESTRIQRSADKTVRDTKLQLTESEHQRARLEEECRAYDEKLKSLRQSYDELQTSESELQLAKRRAEREASEYKQRALNLERDLVRLRSRLDRPSALAIASPAASPRK